MAVVNNSNNAGKVKAVVFGIDKTDKGELYRVLVYDIKSNRYKAIVLNSDNLKKSIMSNEMQFINVGIKGGKLVGVGASLERFKGKVNRPIVIIARLAVIRKGQKVTVGYRIVNFNGKVLTVKLRNILEYCDGVIKKEGVPVQNAQYVRDKDKGTSYLRAYPECEFEEVLMKPKNSKNVQSTQDKEVRKEEKPLVKNGKASIEDARKHFNDKQWEQIQLGLEKKLPVKIYAKPSLKAEQMEALRRLIEVKVNPSRWAYPEYSAGLMYAYGSIAQMNKDMELILNSKFTPEQVFQLNLAMMDGVDISSINNPEISAYDMSMKRIALTELIYREHAVKGLEQFSEYTSEDYKVLQASID